MTILCRHVPRLAFLAVLALAGCKRADMYDQSRAFPWGSFAYLPNHMTMQAPVAGTVARGAPDVAVPQPAAITQAMLERGRHRFAIDCVPCHGLSGDGEGMIVQRGFPQPPALFSDVLIHAKAQHFYDIITNGHGAMYSYADRVSPADRWAIIAYIRALQTSQRAQMASLSDQDRTQLRKVTP